MTATYRVFTWDCEANGWAPEAAGLSLWALRPVIRDLWAGGWSDVSVLIEREC